MRKRLLSLLLVFCMALSLLPGTAFAAVGDLLNNQTAKNESLLQQLQDFTGESYEEVYDLLDTLGLLDEDGNLVTDQTIDLDGKTYTLEEIEDLLNDPDTDLTQVAEVDGVPIALKDLATIIAIERQLQYLQEKYFTGATFEGESLENLNSLLEQLQGEGMTLAASGDQIVFDTSNMKQSGNKYYISIPSVTVPAGTTISVKFKMDFSDAFKALFSGATSMFWGSLRVFLSDSLDTFAWNSANEVIYLSSVDNMNDANGKEYTLSATFSKDYTGPLYLCIAVPDIRTFEEYEQYFPFETLTFGDIWQNVTFYDAQGFLFQSSSGLSDQWNGYFGVKITPPAMGSSCSTTGKQLSFSEGRRFLEFSLVDENATIVDNTLTYLQRCITGLNADNAVRFQVDATLAQKNDQNHPLIIPKNVFVYQNSGRDDLLYHGYYIIEESSLIGDFPITLNSDSGTTTISFKGLTDKLNSSDGTRCILPRRFSTALCNSTSVTPENLEDLGNIANYTYSIDDFTSTTDCTITLVDNRVDLTLTVSAPEKTYQSGDVIPITITGNEYLEATDETQIIINGTPYTLEELHGSTSGKYITFFYEVKEIDSRTLTVAVNSGITDYWGNSAQVNSTVSNVTLDTPILKNAVLDLTASYNKEAEAINFAISTKQDKDYKTLYTNSGTPFQLLVSVNGGQAVPHAVTMGEDPRNPNNLAFTAAPYLIKPTDQDQTVTVQLQVKDGADWKTVSWATQTVIIGKRVDVTGVTISVVGAGEDYNYTIALSDENIPKLQAQVAPTGAATSGTWYSTDEAVATITQEGQIELQSKTGTVGFYYVADNGTPGNEEDDKKSNELKFTITAGDKLTLLIPQYAQETLLQSGSDATVKWNTNVFDLYPDKDITFTVKLFAGTQATGQPSKTYEVSNTAGGERITSCTIPAAELPVTYPQSQYTVQVSMASPEAKSADASITVLSPPTEMRITSDKTDLTDTESASLTCTISNNPDASGTLSATRMADGAESAVPADSCLSTKSVNGSSSTVTFTPEKMGGTGLYDTYTITFAENETGSANFAPSSDSIVLRVYRSGALEIVGDDTIELDNTSKVDGKLPTDSEGILELRQELGLIEYVSINADAYNWSSFRDGIKWVSDHPEVVGVYYRQGGLWDNIEDLGYETYLPQTQMAVSSTTDGTATITATHAATGMNDSVTVNVETLWDKFYLFQATPAETTQVTYTNGAGETKTVKTNEDGLLAVYEESGIKSDVYFRSGSEKEPNLGTILNSALSSGERDAAKLQLYPLNTITLVPAAKTELYLVKPDGTPFANETVTLRGGVYLGGYYCEGAQMGPTSGGLISGATDGTYTTDKDGKLTVYMDATQFEAEGYTGQLTNAALDYWFELRDLSSGSETYFPTLVHVQGSMSADRILRTGSSVVNLEAVPQGQENQPFLTAQTMSYGKESGDDLQVRDLMGSTGRVGPNSTYKYAELTSHFMLWGVDAANGKATVSMTGENGFAPKGQTVEDSTFPFSSIPIVTNTTVLTKETMTDSGWLKPETAAKLRACVYQNDQLLKDVSMPFQVIDLTDVKLVNEDAKAVVLDMQGSFVDGLGSKTSRFNFGSSSISNAFNSDIQDMLLSAANTSNPPFKVLITPTEDSTVFNVLIWGGYDSLELEGFDYDQNGLSMNYELLDTERQVGVPSVGDLSDMAQGNYHPGQDLKQNFLKTANSGLDFGAQLTGCYEGQFYYDVDQHEWAFRVVSGGFTAGAGVGFEANVNFWAGPVPITASFGAGLSLQLSFKAATVYTDQVKDTSGWSDEAKASDSVNDFLTTLRINGYISAFGGVGFDYSIVALKIGLFGKLTGDSTNQFLSQTYLTSGQQRNGQALGVEGEVGIKVVVKLLFISYDGALVSGKVNYNQKFGDYQYINDYWTGNGTSTTSLQGTPTLLSRAYLEAYANGERTWNDPSFGSIAAVVQNDANPGSEPVVNDDGSISAYISDSNSQDFYDSRIMVGDVGTEGQVLDANGYGDLSPSLSGTGSFTVAAWSRLNTSLEKNADDPITPDEQKQLLNSTEIMVSVYKDGWTTEKLTDNASPDLAPVTAVGGNNAVVFWRNVYTSTDAIYSTDSQEQFAFDTKDTIYFSIYDGNDWSDAQMAYNGSLGGVVGLKTAMLSDGTSILVFTLDRGSSDPENPMEGYELAYRTVSSDGTLGDLVVLTNDKETDSNPQVVAADDSFILGWYSTQDGGDIRLQAVGANGQLYNGSSEHAIPASVKAISQDDELNINSNFQFAKQSGQDVDGLTLVWAETATNADGEADHSVLYGTQLCKIDGSVYLSSPQALVTLPDRTLSNSFSAWKDSSGKINAYIFGTQYSETETETVAGYAVPADTDQLLTGGGSLTAQAVSVDAISVDYADLQVNSFTTVGFTLRNTGTTALTDLKVDVGGYASNPVTLNPGESADVTVMYKTGSTITNPAYTVSAGSQLASGTLHLNYNDVGISSMKVVSENAGKRTVQITLYNDAAAKLEGSGRTVALNFYTDSENTQSASVTLVGSQSGVSASGSTVTLSGDALRRMDQGSMTFQVTYDLKSYVTGTLGESEIPASGVYLYAKADVKENGQTMAEYATGNNSSAVLLTGAYARTGEKTTLDVTQTNSNGTTTAVVELNNNSLQDQTTATLVASLLDENGQVLETQTTGITGTLYGETAQTSTIQFSQLGSRVVVHAAAAGENKLFFDGLPVSMDDFTADASGALTYSISGVSAYNTLVTAISGSGEKVTINGQEFTSGSGSLSVPIGAGETVITVSIGSTTYTLHITSTHTSGGGGSGTTASYRVIVEPSENGTVKSSHNTASAGTTVTLTATPQDGYRLTGLTVTDGAGNNVTLSDKGDGKYTFVMPSRAVTVKASFAPITAGDLPFIDVPAGAWYEDGVRYVYQNGLMAGTSATTFGPDVTTTRGMIATILWRLEGSPQVDYAMAFDDVAANSWYAEAIRWAASEGIVSGYGDGRFGPDDIITREQMAAMLYRYAQYKGYDVSVGEDTNILSYTDFEDLSEYAIPAMQWAVGAGIISGTSESTLGPRGNASRAQVAVILTRYCENVAKQ